MDKNKIVFIFCLILLSNIFYGQPGPPPGPGSNCWPPPCIPIDGGISIFTFISVFFGYKFLSKNN
jgi:hypothetical protein